jgi:hypothetical protein
MKSSTLRWSTDLAGDLERCMYGCGGLSNKFNQESRWEGIGPQIISEQSLHSIGLGPSCEGLNVLQQVVFIGPLP